MRWKTFEWNEIQIGSTPFKSVFTTEKKINQYNYRSTVACERRERIVGLSVRSGFRTRSSSSSSCITGTRVAVEKIIDFSLCRSDSSVERTRGGSRFSGRARVPERPRRGARASRRNVRRSRSARTRPEEALFRPHTLETGKRDRVVVRLSARNRWRDFRRRKNPFCALSRPRGTTAWGGGGGAKKYVIIM